MRADSTTRDPLITRKITMYVLVKSGVHVFIILFLNLTKIHHSTLYYTPSVLTNLIFRIFRTD
jgi:flagellar biosynthesis protein FliQ